MHPDRKHTLGAILMWGGVVLAAVAALAILPASPMWGAVGFLAGVAASLEGMRIKKRYCPRCRRGVCDLPPSPPGSNVH